MAVRAGLVDPEAIRRIAAAGVFRSLMAHAGAPSTGELARLGVARVSVGPMITLGAMACVVARRRSCSARAYGS